MAKDSIGNTLKVGDLVRVPQTIVTDLIGVITSVSEGGLAIASGPQNAVMAGKIIIKLDMDVNLDFNPALAINLLKIVNPKKENGATNN